MRSIFITVSFIFLLVCHTDAQQSSDESGYVADTSEALLVDTEQQDQEDGKEEEPDILSDTSITLRPIHIGKDTLGRWRKEKGFAYMATLDSLLRHQRDTVEMPRDIPSGSTTGSWFSNLIETGIFRAFLWMCALGFVGFIVYRLLISRGIFVRPGMEAAVREELPEEELKEESDYGRLAEAFARKGEYREAVRCLFLRTLRQLSDKGYIQWAPDKTNSAYVQEIQPGQKQDFSSLVLMFEYTWYGHLNLNEEQYRGISDKFNRFMNGNHA